MDDRLPTFKYLGYPDGYLDSRDHVLDYQRGLFVPFKSSIIDQNVDCIFDFTSGRVAALFYNTSSFDSNIYCDLIVRHGDSWFIYIHTFSFKELTDEVTKFLDFSREYKFFSDITFFNQLKNSDNSVVEFEKYLLLPPSGTWEGYEVNHGD